MALKVNKKSSRYLAKLVTENRAPCAFCHREVDDEVTYGKLYAIGDIQCHYLCALLSCCLVQKGPEEEGLFGFTYKDILAELERSKKHKCSYCGRGGANLGCSVSACRKQFHLPCGRERDAVSLFYGSYKSFCQVHAPKQRISEHIMSKAKLRMRDEKKKIIPKENDGNPSEDMVCVICYEAVDAFPTVNTFWPPCCARDAWFHRSCLQRMALSAGMHYLKCPLCNDKENFYDAVIKQGYYVPDRDAAWELEQNAFAEIYERPLICTAEACRCPMGRSHDSDQGEWDIKLCLLCGSVGSHAACMSASETARYVCLTCTPAAPRDMEALAATIERLIQEEQARSASAARRGPVMPTRMSIRRTKGGLAMMTKPSTSRAHGIKTECQSPARSPNIQASRQDLNLKSPRKLMQDSPKKSIQTSYKSPESPMKQVQITESYKNMSPNKLNDSYKNVLSPSKQNSYKHTDSYKHLLSKLDELRSLQSYKNVLSSAKQKDSYKNMSPSKNDSFNVLSPMKLIEQRLNEKFACKGELDEDLVGILRNRFTKPGPLSGKKKIIDDILNGLFDNLNSLKQKESVREWCSPRKNNITEEEAGEDAASDNVSKSTENTIENKGNCIQSSPCKSTGKHSTPIKLKRSMLNDMDIDKESVKNSDENRQNIKESVRNCDEKHQGIEDLEESGNCGDEKHQGIDENDDSSNSTFQLPPEFIANDMSNQSLEQSPRRRTIEMKDSSLEISEDNNSVNIDVVKINDSSNVKRQDGEICAFKFGRLDKEKLEDSNFGMDLESFKKGYLNEVGKEYKCNNRNDLNCGFDDDIRSGDVKSKGKKRKVSEGVLVPSFDKNEAKKRKMSENDLNLSFSSDDFEVKTIKPIKENLKEKEFERKRNKQSTKDKKERKVRRYSKNGGHKIQSNESDQTKEQKCVGRKLKGKDKLNKDGRENKDKHVKESLDDKGKLKDLKQNVLDRKHHKLNKDNLNIDRANEKQKIKKHVDDDKIVMKYEERNLLDRKHEKVYKDSPTIDKKHLKSDSKNVEKKEKNKERKQVCKEKVINDNKKVNEKRRSEEKRKVLKYEERNLLDRKHEKVYKKDSPTIDKKNLKSDSKNVEKKEKNKERKQDCKEKVINDKNKVNEKRRSEEKRNEKRRNECVLKDKPKVVDDRRNKHKNIAKRNKDKKYRNSVKHPKDKERDTNSEKYGNRKRKNDEDIEVTIDSESKLNRKTKLSIRNSEKDISVKIKWKKKLLRLKIESKKAEKVERVDSKFKQYVLQYFSEVTPKEVLVKPEKEVSPLKRKYIKQDKTPDKLKQMSIQNFFKVKSPED